MQYAGRHDARRDRTRRAGAFACSDGPSPCAPRRPRAAPPTQLREAHRRGRLGAAVPGTFPSFPLERAGACECARRRCGQGRAISQRPRMLRRCVVKQRGSQLLSSPSGSSRRSSRPGVVASIDAEYMPAKCTALPGDRSMEPPVRRARFTGFVRTGLPLVTSWSLASTRTKGPPLKGTVYALASDAFLTRARLFTRLPWPFGKPSSMRSCPMPRAMSSGTWFPRDRGRSRSIAGDSGSTAWPPRRSCG